MRNQLGFTTLEIVISVAMLSLFGGMGMLATTSYVNVARIHQVTNQMADSLSIAKARAIGGAQDWRIRLGTDFQTDEQRVVVERLEKNWSCQTLCPSTSWQEERRYSFTVKKGIGILPSDSAVQAVQFNHSGTVTSPPDEAFFRVCAVLAQADGTTVCRSGTILRLTVKPFSGITMVTKE